MDLSQVNLNGYGSFRSEPGSFLCKRYHLPREWDWVLTNDKILLRQQHNGCGYLQLDPPGGAALFKEERGQLSPNMFVWCVTQTGAAPQAFANVYRPTIPLESPDAEPDEYSCQYDPASIHYRLVKQKWCIETDLIVPPDEAAVVATVRITNTANVSRKMSVVPVLRPHMAPFSLAPWDVPALYQTAAFFKNSGVSGIWMETRNPDGDPAKRLHSAVLTDLQPTQFEVSCQNFVGHGTWENPQALWRGKLGQSIGQKRWPYAKVSPENAVLGQSPVAAFWRNLHLRAGSSHTFTWVYGRVETPQDGSLPKKQAAMSLARYCKPAAKKSARLCVKEHYDSLFSTIKLDSPDKALNRYVSEFLTLQLDWVTRLDRGWPTGMRGVRDSAQDVNGIIPFDAALVRRRLSELFSCQRRDGWFVRQYSTAGSKGAHDTRAYVDGGIWVWECLYEYLCYTRDFTFLDQSLGWLDAENESTVLEHALCLFDYYRSRSNRGKHGLCKIRGGDWNDSVNRAGLQGRGESVMVSCQVVLGLKQCTELLRFLKQDKPSIARKINVYQRAYNTLREAVQTHAYNKSGYFNGVYNDAGQWIFSDRDPDGKKRINGPVNSFAVIAGVAEGKVRDKVLAALDSLRGPYGWRLFSPGIGTPPIENLGRIGSGDLAVGIGENGTCYNHGAQGFLGRAAWTAGRGGWLYDILRFMFSYDQDAHPIKVAKAPPYAVVNHWRESMGQEGEGGDSFLSGSISTAIRNVYQGMIGFRPGLTSLLLDPSIPADWPSLEAVMPFRGGQCRIRIENPQGCESGVAACTLNGAEIQVVWCEQLGRRVAQINLDETKNIKDLDIILQLG